MQGVTFSVNVCRADLSYVQRTLPHMIRSLRYPFVEKVAAVDLSDPTGKFKGAGSADELLAVLGALVTDGCLDRIDVIPWDDAQVDRIMRKYFGEGGGDIKCSIGTAIYQYLYALDVAAGDFVLHADSDILFRRAGEVHWIDEAIELMLLDESVVITTPEGGPPKAEGVVEYVLGRKMAKPAARWHTTADVSTRYFLLHKGGMESKLLPIVQKQRDEPLERSLTHTFSMKGLERRSLNDDEQWAIHPLYHDEHFLEHLDDLIWAVENGVFPFRRQGDRYDLLTDGDNIRPWLRAIEKAKARTA